MSVQFSSQLHEKSPDHTGESPDMQKIMQFFAPKRYGVLNPYHNSVLSRTVEECVSYWNKHGELSEQMRTLLKEHRLLKA
jgi:hypothetical protein